jgi:caspase domain-containing protein/uncharacterized protein DUF1566
MKRSRYFIFIFLSLILSFPCYALADRGLSVKPISPLGTEVKGNQWLFVIGINTYIYWPRLKTAVNDAEALKKVLLSRYHFDKDHLIELYDDQATEKNIIAKLRFLAEKVGKDDSLVIFYAGHGNLDSITKEGSWIPVESGTNDASTWITNHDIKNYLRIDAIRAKHILLISDSCFAGDFFRGERGKLPEVTEKVIKKAYKLSSRQAITSGGLEPVSDAGFGNNSVFSHFLVNTLNENQKPFLVPSDMFPYIKAGVAENADQFPQFGSLKGMGGQQGGELVLFLQQKSRLKELSADASQKSKELERLRQLEIEAKEAKRKEDVEIAKREREVAALDEKIAGMKKNLGTVTADTDDNLDAIFAMVQQKSQMEAKRRVEIEGLKAKNRKKRRLEIMEDIRKYEKIISSPFGRDMKEAAWKNLVNRYPEMKGLEVGDIDDVLTKIGLIKVIARDGQFVAYDNGTVKDTKTGLMWASKDNGEGINWEPAKRYCENYRGSGYADWRMPTQDELAGLYDESKSYRYKPGTWKVHLTKLIELSACCLWALDPADEEHVGDTFIFDQDHGRRGGGGGGDGRGISDKIRALPVRSGK